MTKTTATEMLADTARDGLALPATADATWLLTGAERRSRCFRLHFRSSTSGSSPTASDFVGLDTVRTAPACAASDPTAQATSCCTDASATSPYLVLEVVSG